MSKIFAIFIDTCLLLLIYLVIYDTAKVTYVSVERPVVSYYNDKYIGYLNLTATRQGRQNPIYYTDIHFESRVAWDNNLTIGLLFYEYTNNMHLVKFFELELKMCDMVHKHMLLGPILKQGKLKKPCPYPSDDYHLYNLTLPHEVIPNSFPFTRGRIVCNMIVTGTREQVVNGHIDMEIKVLRTNTQKKG